MTPQQQLTTAREALARSQERLLHCRQNGYYDIPLWETQVKADLDALWEAQQRERRFNMTRAALCGEHPRYSGPAMDLVVKLLAIEVFGPEVFK